MLPVIAIVGRPNVGKSTLFNRLTKTRDALVHNMPGVTRDRLYGEGVFQERPYIVIDTGGLSGAEHEIDGLMAKQTWQAIAEADLVLFLVDGREGLNSNDSEVAEKLRKMKQDVILVVNKTDGVDPDVAMSDFFQFGFNHVHPISAEHSRGINLLMEKSFESFPDASVLMDDEPDLPGVKVAVIGRPNVGKSTLINRLMGEERLVVCNMPGTTLDSIYIPIEKDGKPFVLIDTAGIRRRGKVTKTLEKFSVVKSLQAIEKCNVVVFLFDGQEGITEPDMKLLSFALEAGRALVICVNKWDGLSEDQKETIKKDVDRRLGFVDFADMHFISALHGTNVGYIFRSVTKAYESSTRQLTSSLLTKMLGDIVAKHPPPMVKGRRAKLKYANPGGKNPPIIVIHGNQTEDLPGSYQKYLINAFRTQLKFVGTPLRLSLKQGENPYKDKKNKLTPRQTAKKKRLMSHVKKRKN